MFLVYIYTHYYNYNIIYSKICSNVYYVLAKCHGYTPLFQNHIQRAYFNFFFFLLLTRYMLPTLPNEMLKIIVIIGVLFLAINRNCLLIFFLRYQCIFLSKNKVL